MPTIEVPAGPIDYEDTGGDGPVVVFLHGLLMSSTTWRDIVPHLQEQYRCVTPTLPLGSHRRPMNPDADLTLLGHANLVADFIEALDLRDVTLVSIDWGGGLLLPAAGRDERIARYVACPSEAFDNFPPGLPGRLAVLAARMPGGIQLALRQLRVAWLRRLPMMFGQLFKHGVPNDVVRDWTAPALASAKVRRDVRKYGSTLPPKTDLVAWTEKLADFTGPALILWAPEGKMIPPEHGARLANLIPNARHVDVPDAYTMVNEDQPELFIQHVRQFLTETDAEIAAPQGIVSASREIAAGAERIFELIADPAQQPRWDGNDNLAEAAPGQRVDAVGAVFTMTLTRDGVVRENRVVEFAEGSRIAWRPNEPGQAAPGHLWRWELEPVDSSTTRVTHTYDWTQLTDESRFPRARATTADKLRASLDRLAELAEQS